MLPVGTARKGIEVGFRKRDNSFDILSWQRMHDVAFIVVWLCCAVASANQESTVDSTVGVSAWIEQGNRHLGFDEARRAETFQDRGRNGISLVTDVQGLTTPVLEKPPDPVLIDVSQRKKTEPNHSGAEFIVGSILRLQALCNLVSDQFGVQEVVDAMRQYLGTGKLHATTPDIVRLRIR